MLKDVVKVVVFLLQHNVLDLIPIYGRALEESYVILELRNVMNTLSPSSDSPPLSDNSQSSPDEINVSFDERR